MAGDRGGPTVIETGGGGAGWFVAVVVLIVALIGGYFLFNGSVDNGKDVNVKIQLPKVDNKAN